jgi:8-oxo-dGTP pyrophosphatase MutT (NUDIX family)
MSDAAAPAESPFSEVGFRLRAGRVLHRAPPVDRSSSAAGAHLGPSDFDLNPDLRPKLVSRPPCPAAVLVPIIAHKDLTVLFTQRTESLPRHAGQIALPGGKMEADETEPVATALREAQEEIGLDPRFVEPLGYLDAYRTGTGYRIVPVVALVREGFELALEPGEVAEAFEVPLAFLMDARNHKTHVRVLGGAERRFHAMPFQERYIWGATAGIMKNMHERFFSA